MTQKELVIEEKGLFGIPPFPASVSTYQSPLILFLFAGLLLLLNGFQAWHYPFIDLAEGLGYDGAWYFHPANHFLPKMDNYHLFRIVPATLVYLLKLIVFTKHDYISTARAFQLANILWISVAMAVTRKISIHMSFSWKQQLFFFSVLFLNFHVLKDSYFNPVMTDTFVLCLSICLLYFFLKKDKAGLFIGYLLMLFTFPLGGFVLQIIYMVHQAKDEAFEFLLPQKFGVWLASSIGILFFSLTGAIVFILGRRTVLTFPDEINIYLFPISLLSVSIILFVLIKSHFNLFQLMFLVLKRQLTISNSGKLVLAASILVYVILPSFNNSPAKGFSGNFSIAPPIYLTLKPFIGYFDNIMYLGPVVVLFLLFQFQIWSKKNLNFSYLVFSFFINLFLLKPEARHSLFLLPLLAYVVTTQLDFKLLTQRNLLIFSLVCLAFSKFWYPTYLATFPKAYEIFTPKTNHEIFQLFPIQHYFMFIGPLISHYNYFIWFGVILLLIIYLLMNFRNQPLMPRRFRTL